MNEEQRADARQNGSFFTVNLKDRDDPWGQWFQTDIDGTYDECYAEVYKQRLWRHYKIQIVEA